MGSLKSFLLLLKLRLNRIALSLISPLWHLIPSPFRSIIRSLLWAFRVLSPDVAEVTKSNTKDAYDLVYRRADLLAQYLEPARLAFYEEIADYCVQVIDSKHPRSASPFRIVDLGCGTGHLLHSLWQRLNRRLPVELWGIDYAPSGTYRARNLLPQARLLVADIYNNPLPPGFFDLVLCVETLEHLHFPAKAVSEMVRLCKPFGKIVITVPDGAKDNFGGHLNFWRASELEEFLAPYGLREIVSVASGIALRGLLVKE